MLLDRGPVDPIDVDAWTQPGPRSALAGDAASLAGQLAGAQATIGRTQATMASFTTSRVEGSGGVDLTDAIAAHAAQPATVDPTIGAIAGNAEAQTGAITGFANDAASDLASAVVPPLGPQPAYGPDPSWPIGEGNPPAPPEEPPPPGGTVADFIVGLYQRYLRRTPALGEINSWSALWPRQADIEHGILYSQENGDKVNALYQQYLERDVSGGELEEHRQRKDSLDDVEANVQGRA